MNISPAGQAVVFLYSALGGVVGGLLFDIFRALRYRHKVSRAKCAAQDLIFWFAAALLAFFLLYKINNGEPRAFIFLGLGLGAAIYSLTVGSAVLKLFIALGGFARKAFLILIKALLFPVLLFYRLLKRPFLLVLMPFKRLKRIMSRAAKSTLKNFAKGGRNLKNRLKRI